MTKKGATGDFFSFLQKKNPKMDNIFLHPKKIKLRPPDWPQFWPPAGQETFFMDSLTIRTQSRVRDATPSSSKIREEGETPGGRIWNTQQDLEPTVKFKTIFNHVSYFW